jgi:uncharacterized protein YcaQ
MESLRITNEQARRFILAHQSLWPPHELEGTGGILDYIHRVGCIQFDPLDIVGRNPELVLQSRISDFQPVMLQGLLYEDRELVDGWDKNMSIYGVRDWPYFRRRREAARREVEERSGPVTAILDQVRQAIEDRGPSSSIDLDHNQIVDWHWGPTRLARVALENMWSWGELIVHHKVRTRKVYDFAHRHIPADVLSTSDPNTTEEQYQDWHILRRIGSVGLLWNKSGGDAWLGIHGTKSKERTTALTRLLTQGKVVEVRAEGVEPPLYMRSEDRTALDKTLQSDAPPPHASILAPLDNLLWARELVEQLFGFSYTWEVYKPVAEREYGYYVLPVLYGDRFVARFEPARDKRSGALVVKGWWWEPGVTPSSEMHASLRDCFERFLRYLGAGSIAIDNKVSKREGLGWLT